MQYLQRFGCGLFGALFLCLAGCGKSDKALPVPVISDQTIAESVSARETGDDGKDRDGPAEGSGGQNTVFVYVCGAVREPQVVELPEGSRVQDALAAAGGFTDEADRDAVNLAGLISDGQKLYFPAEGEGVDVGQTTSAQSGKVNINTADATALCTLPGIGPARAEAILTYRKQKGPFETITDIMQVPGIKEGAYEKISDRITVN